MFPIARLSQEEHRTSWLELFYDLVFVAAVSQLGVQLNQHLTVEGCWRFVCIFISVWWCWSGSTNFASRYVLPELHTRLLTALELMGAALMAASIGSAFLGKSLWFVEGYIVVRLLLIAKYMLAARQHPAVRVGTQRLCMGFLIGVGCWLASLGQPHPEGFWLAGFVVDLSAVLLNSTPLQTVLPNASHLPERFGLFTLIVLGESIVGVVNALQPGEVGIQGAVRGLISLLLAFCLWWIYFDGLNDTVIRIARIHKRMGALNSWIFCHLILFMGLTLLSVGVRRVVISTDPLSVSVLWLGAIFSLAALGVIHLLSLCPSCPMPARVYWQHLIAPTLCLGAWGWHLSVYPLSADATLITLLTLTAWQIIAEHQEDKSYTPADDPQAYLKTESI